MLCQSSLVPFFLSHSGKESFEANSIREIRSRTRDIFQFSRMQFVLDRMLLEMQTIERRYLAGLDLVSRFISRIFQPRGFVYSERFFFPILLEGFIHFPLLYILHSFRGKRGKPFLYLLVNGIRRTKLQQTTLSRRTFNSQCPEREELTD